MDDIKTEKSSEKKPRAKKATAETNLTFEEAMTRLEAVVRALEDGKTPLEESMKLYEEGVSDATAVPNAARALFRCIE